MAFQKANLPMGPYVKSDLRGVPPSSNGPTQVPDKKLVASRGIRAGKKR